MNLSNVLDIVDQDDANKVDYSTFTNNLHADPQTGNLEFIRSDHVTGYSKRDIPFKTTPWSESQLLTKLGMPVQYFNKIKEESPDRYADHFNYWAQKSDGVVRLRARDLGNEGLIRGVVSDRYSVLDNNMATDAMGLALRKLNGEFEVNDFNLSENRLHLRVTYPGTERAIGLLPDTLLSNSPRSRDLNRIGTDFTNSETGYSSFNVGLMIYRLICTNGMHGWVSDDVLSRRHVGVNMEVISQQVSALVSKHIVSAPEYLARYEKTTQITILHPFVVMVRLAMENKFSTALAENVKEVWEGDPTAFGVINAFARAARDMGDNMRRMDVEAMAGRLINMSEAKWASLSMPELI